MHATVTIVSLVLTMALLLPVGTLARITSLLLLIVFALVNLALLRIKRHGANDYAGFTTPRWLPLAGFLSSLGFLAYQLFAGIVA